MAPHGNFDTERASSRIGWWIFALVLAAVLIVALSDYLGWLVFGIFLYYVARPISRKLRQQGLSGGTAAAITLGLVVLPFVGVIFVLALLAIVQFATLELTDFEAAVELLFPDVDTDELPATEAELYPFAEDLATDPTVASVGQWVSGLLGRFLTASYLLFITFLFAFFLVRDEHRLAEWFRVEVLDKRPRLNEYLSEVDKGLQSIFFGYTLTILAIMLFAGLIYTGLNAIAPEGLEIPLVLLLATVTGLASVIPLLGRTMVYIGIVGYLSIVAIQTDPTTLWFPIAFYAIMGIFFDGLIRTYVRPVLSGRMFPTGLVLFAYILGPPIFGWYGIFLGPVLMVVTVLFVQQQLPRLLHGESDASRANDERNLDVDE
jgi:predicted PurR-regulated permease PerM